MLDGRHALLGTLALLAATVATLFGVALLADDEAPPPVAVEPDPEKLLELSLESTPRVARRVEALRSLRFRRVPEPTLSDAERLRGLAERAIDKPRVRRQLAVGEAELRLLGLLEPDQSLGDVASDVSALAVAYYDPGRDRLFLVGDAVPAGAELTEFILAHELTHALEDQRFGLPESDGLSDDRVLAANALVEGTATALMDRYAGRHLDPIALAVEAAELDAGAGGELPRFAEAEVEFAYLGGAEFVEALLRLGRDWTLIDYALERRLPATSEQVLHPQKYLADERPLPVVPPPSPGSGWRAVDRGSLGEFGTGEVLRAGAPGLGAERGAAGWGGDHYRLFARRGAGGLPCPDDCRATHALGVAWRGDARAEARELLAALDEFVENALGGTPAGLRAWRLEGGWAAVSASGDRVGLGLAPTATAARRIAGP